MSQTTLDVKQGNRGQERKLSKLMAQGWRVVTAVPVGGGRSVIKTVGLGLIFLPLAIFGNRKQVTRYILEKGE